MKKSLILVLLQAFFLLYIHAENIFDSEFILCTKEQGSELIVTEDAYINRLSPFDRASRLKKSTEVSREEHLAFIKQQTMDWSEEESFAMKTAFDQIKTAAAPYAFNLPEKVYFIKSTGNEEGRSAYCRSMNIVVLPVNMINLEKHTQKDITELCMHELFHIYSRNNLDVREKLYNSIGFYKTGELNFPEELDALRITNPDSVEYNYYFKAQTSMAEVDVMPVLLSRSPVYEEGSGKEFVHYLRLVFFQVNTSENGTEIVKGTNYKVISLGRIRNFYEKVGMNTSYIIHPEEILADNFVLMLCKNEENGSEKIKTPSIIENMEKLMLKAE